MLTKVSGSRKNPTDGTIGRVETDGGKFIIRAMIRLSIIAIGLIAALAGGPATAFDKFLALGTSSSGGVYWPVGQSICKFINASRIEHLVRCLAYNTGGSVYNIQALSSGELDVAITRADLAYQAYRGEGLFSALGANKGLRTITNLYGQPVAVIVKKGSGIISFDHFDGRKINIGNLGSGKRDIADHIFKIMGWSNERFDTVTEYTSSKTADAFCKGEIDIVIESLGIPAKFYDRVTKECGGVFLSLPDRLISGFKKSGPFFYDDVIPGDVYPNNPADVKTVGIKIVLMTLARVDKTSIGIVSKAIHEDLAKFTATHPALARSNRKTMIEDGIHVPLHDGARDYYRTEKGAE